MLNRLLRSFRREDEGVHEDQDAQASAPGISRRRLDSIRRSADAEVAATAGRQEVREESADEGAAPPEPPAPIPTVAPFRPYVAESPEAKVKELLPTVLGVENKAVREFLIACAKDDDEVWTDERRQRRADAMEAAILTGDPLDVALDLYERMPARRGLPNPAGELRRLNFTFDEVHRKAWKLAGREIRFSDAQLRKAIAAMGKLVASGLYNTMDMSDYFYRYIVQSAAADNWPKWKAPLIAAFSDAFAGHSFSHKDVSALIEKLLEETELTPADIPELAAADDAGAKLDAIRATIAAELGEPFGTALLRVLDARSGYLEPKNIPELDVLRTLSPEERGIGFVKFLDVLTGLDRHGLTHWGQLKKEGGKFRFGISYQEMPAELSFLFQPLTRRKIELPDADRTLARFCDLLPKLFFLKDRKILDLFLETMKQHPHGATVSKMREIVERTPEPTPTSIEEFRRTKRHPFDEYRIEIEEVLRFLPSGSLAASDMSACLSGTTPAPEVLQGLPPLPLPELDFTRYGCWDELGDHFSNFLDARLYDEPHRDLLDKLAGLHERLQAHHDQGGQRDIEALVEIVRASGFTDGPHGFRDFSPLFLADVAGVGAEIRNRVEVFAPFVAEHPEQARRLSLQVATLGTGASPSRKWLDEGHEALDGLACEVQLAMLDALMESPISGVREVRIDATLRSLIYLSAKLDPQLAGPRLVKFAVRHCYAKQSGHGTNPGMKDEKLGNACVVALSEMREGEGIPYLARIQSRVNYPKVKSFIDKRLDAAAANAGMSRGELDEVTVPTHGLDHNGSLTHAIADGKAVLRIDGDEVVTEWIAGDGKAVKSPSTAMKADAEGLKAFRSLVKEIKADLSVQADRLQRIYLEKREWPVEAWYQRYCAQPLVGPLTRRLIWWLDSTDGTSIAVLPSADGQALYSVKGEEVFASADAKVRLWHPIDAEVTEIEGWRARLDELQLEQPFAQAWREVYMLTDAERETGTYSNRWAAHILRQHQTMELARANGWRVTHRLGYDVRNDEPWHRVIADYGLVAEYWVEGCSGEHAEFSPGGAFTYISTDRLQFHRIDGKAKDSARGPKRGDTVPLIDVPAIVFSEIMRQGDLFTSVASIGNDPTWLDDGAEAEHPNSWRRRANDYWRGANTAELEASARRRRAILERTIPRLKIADKLSLDDRYLYVQGTRNRYRIHLGAGGAFKGERHLCIVPKSEPATGKVWLPFEGDRTLSIILSKALLLAADDKITDRGIRRQIGLDVDGPVSFDRLVDPPAQDGS